MKKMHKVLAIAAAGFMVLSLFAGCGEQPEVNLSDEIETTTSTTQTGGEVTSSTGSAIGGTTTTSKVITGNPWTSSTGATDRDLGDVTKHDLKGATITIYGAEKPDSSKSKTDAAHAQAISSLEKSMNCKVKFVKATNDKTRTETMKNVMSNTHFADIITSAQHGVISYLLSDLLNDLNKIDTVNLNASYMNIADGVNAFHLSNGYWAVNQPLGIATSGNYLYFNKRLMKEVTGDENYPYKLMKQNKWNISEWRTLNKKGTKELDGDGKMTDKDQWGVVQIDIGTAGFSAVLQAQRALMIKNNNGILEFNMEDGKCIPAINLAADIYYKDNAVVNKADEEGLKLFTSGHGLFLGGARSSDCSKLADMKDDFGILPFPLGDGQKEYSVCTNWNTGIFAIPKCVPKKNNALNNAGAFLQAYMEVSQDVVEAMFNEYRLRYCRDDESKDNLMTGYKAQFTTPSAAVANDEAVKMGTYRVCYDMGSGKDANTTLSANKGISIKAIKDLNDKLAANSKK